jgi:hypothetical protein
MWTDAAGSYIKTLTELGRCDEAVARATEFLASVAHSELGYVSHLIRIPLALAQARASAHAEAATQAERVIEELRALGSSGLRLAVAYRARARIARLALDAAGVRHYANLTLRAFGPNVNPRLAARYVAPLHELNAATQLLDNAAPASIMSATELSSIHTSMERCRSPEERAKCSLELLLQSVGAVEGRLYAVRETRAALVAQIGSCPLPAEVDRTARQQLESPHADRDETEVLDSSGNSIGSEESWQGEVQRERCRRVVLCHATEAGTVTTGLAILIAPRDRPFVHPTQLACELSRLALESGDVF